MAFDPQELLSRLERIRRLIDEFSRVQRDSARQREVAERLGRALDEARRALRPELQSNPSAPVPPKQAV